MPRTTFKRGAGLCGGFDSGLERRIASQLDTAGVPFGHETTKLKYSKPLSHHTYTPDFTLPNGIIVEAKGVFDSDDRAKHLLVQAQHPQLDIRFVFSRSAAPIYKGSPTTNASWCIKHGFKYADKLIPQAWLKEPPK